MTPGSKKALAPVVRADASHLVVVDVQPRLAGAMAPADRQRVLDRAGLLLQVADMLKVPVAVTEQYPEGLGTTEPALVDRMPPGVAAHPKTAFSCCGADGFLRGLDFEQRPQVLLCGMETHVCILQTALELTGRGFEVFVVEDAVCSRDPANHANAIARLRQWGITVTCAESVVFEWVGDAAHPRFKDVSALLKTAPKA